MAPASFLVVLLITARRLPSPRNGCFSRAVQHFANLKVKGNEAVDKHESHERSDGMRVNKIFGEKYSRREADKIVDEGSVTINGKVARAGDLVRPMDFVKLNGKRFPFAGQVLPSPRPAPTLSQKNFTAPLKIESRDSRSHVYIVYNKPAGIECTTDRRIQDNVVDAIGHPQRIFPVGRLDKDSTGVLVLTSDGRLPNACLRAEQGKSKTYEVTTDRPVTSDDCKRLAQGVVITTLAQSASRPITARTLPCRLHVLSRNKIKMIIQEGRNRQVRKMLGALGYRVTQLHRSSFMGLAAQGLKPGAWRLADDKEMLIISKALAETGDSADAAGSGQESPASD